MKKRILFLCSVIFVSVILCSCDKEEIDKTAEKVGDTVETIASEAKDHVEGMIEDGTVDDGDGYIGDHTDESKSTAEPTDDKADAEAAEDDSLFGTDTKDTGEHM